MQFFEWVVMQFKPSEMFPRALQTKPKNLDIQTLQKQSLLHACRFLASCVSERLFRIVALVVQQLSCPTVRTFAVKD